MCATISVLMQSGGTNREAATRLGFFGKLTALYSAMVVVFGGQIVDWRAFIWVNLCVDRMM